MTDPLEPYGCPSCRNEPCRCVTKLPTEEESEAQVEAQKRAMGLSDPFPPGHLGDYMDQIRRQNMDLAMMLRRMIQGIERYCPDHSLAIQAKSLLQRFGLQGSPIRDDQHLPPGHTRPCGDAHCPHCGWK